MLNRLQEIHEELKALRAKIKKEQRDRVSKNALRMETRKLGTVWFQELAEPLKKSAIAGEVLDAYSNHFTNLIRISAPNNLKTSYVRTLNSILKDFSAELIIPVTKRGTPASHPLFDTIFSNLTSTDESD